MKYLSLFLIRIYQKYISPFLGNNCRFYPSCSEHTYKSIQNHGMIKGIYLGLKQIIRCHPFYKPQKDNL